MSIDTRDPRPHPDPRSAGRGAATSAAGPSGLLSAAARAGDDGIAVDPITAEIVRSALVAITDEMKTNLMRTAYNMFIYEALDFPVGLFADEGKTVSIGLGLPMFIGGLSDAIKAKLAPYGKDGIQPGD